MANDKKPQPGGEAADDALVHKVDVMLSPDLPNDPADPKPDDKGEAIEVSKGTSSSAPPLGEPTSLQAKLDQLNQTTAAAAKSPDPEVKSEPVPPAKVVSTDEAVAPKELAFDDAKTEAAVDDIARHDSDVVLEAEDGLAAKTPAVVVKTKRSIKASLLKVLKCKWTYIGLAVILLGLALVPWTRYKLLGLVIHKELSLTVLDSKTATAVSGASVSFDGAKGTTDATGQLHLKVPLGSGEVVITKQYYETQSEKLTVGFSAPAPLQVELKATGRQVPIKVINKLSGQPLSGAEVKILSTTAKTNTQGEATIVLPASSTTDQASVSLSGYNTATASVTVTSSVLSSNTLSLTPTGQIFFLSNLSGKLDVVRTNLDGSGRQTILAGTGQEDPNNTSLLASRDWHYLVLESKRSGQDALYLIDTSNNNVTQFDNTPGSYSLIGWYNHDFMYDFQATNPAQYQAGHEVIKSYDADTGQLNELDSSQAAGTSSSYGYQTFSDFYIVNNLLVYSTQWYSYDSVGSGYDLSSQSDSIRGVQPSGQGKKDYQTFPVASVSSLNSVLAQTQTIDYALYNNATAQTTYYQFSNGSVAADASLTATTFSQPHPTYLLSPSGNKTLWSELRDGQNSLFIGDGNGASPQSVASSGEYTPYGWYTDNYILLSKGSDELYILPASNGVKGLSPLTVSDYYKPPLDYAGYGYGYGGF